MADTLPSETVTPEAPSNEVKTPATPVVNAVDPAEVERLRKQLEQTDLRNRQLENEAKARQEKEEADRQKQLEENNEWKTIAEQEKAKREALETEQEAARTKAELAAQEKAIFDKFDASVVELAQDTGLTLTSLDDVEGLTAKLEKIAARVSGQTKITPNNPAAPDVPDPTQAEYVNRLKGGDKSALTEALTDAPFIKAMKRQAGIEVE